MNLATALLGATCSAALMGLSLPPWGFRLLAWAGLVPLILAGRSGGMGRAAGVGFVFGVAYGWSAAPAFPGAIAHYYDQPPLFGFFAGTAIFGMTASVYYAGFSLVDRLLQPRTSAIAPMLTAATWTTTEWIRASLFTGTDLFVGNPWALVGYSHASGSLAQIAAWTGVYGIGFVVVAVNAAISECLIARGRADRSSAIRSLVLSVSIALSASIAGGLVLRQADRDLEAGELIEIALVQGDVEVDRRWSADRYGEHLDVYLELTREAVRVGRPALVVWPENAMTFFVENAPIYLELLHSTLAALDVPLLAGGPARESSTRGASRTYNSVFWLTPKGGLEGRYDKTILLPFSEYYPFGSERFVRRDLGEGSLFDPGERDPEPLSTSIGEVGLVVCNEAMLPEVARRRVRAGAEILVSPSNDGWVNDAGFGEQMLAIVGLRSIELRRYLARASTSGPSAIIDPYGRVTVRTDWGRRQLLRGVVEPRLEETFYARHGDIFAVVCLALVLLELAARARVWAATGSGNDV